jgi:hypothetical protein
MRGESVLLPALLGILVHRLAEARIGLEIRHRRADRLVALGRHAEVFERLGRRAICTGVGGGLPAGRKRLRRIGPDSQSRL